MRKKLIYIFHNCVALEIVFEREMAKLEAFLEDYLHPYFSTALSIPDSIEAVFKLRVEIAETQHKAYPNATDIDLSGSFLRCSGTYEDSATLRNVSLHEYPVHVSHHKMDKYIEIVGSNETDLWIPVLRLIEDLTVDAMEKTGAVFIHASGCVQNGLGVLAVGNKGAGKSTILCKMLADFSVDKISNDNCILRSSESGIEVIGWPGFFKLFIGSVVSQKELASFMPGKHKKRVSEGGDPWSIDDKIALYPRQGAEVFNRNIVPTAMLQSIILPRYTADNPVCLKEEPSSHLIGKMGEFVQGSSHPNHPDWLGLGHLSKSTLVENLNRILDSDPNIQVHRLAWSKSLTDLLTEVPALRAHRGSFQWATMDERWPSLRK